MYNYVSVSSGENQYSDFDLDTQNCVPARYVKSKLSLDNGNILVEALPPPRSSKEILSAYNKPVPGYYVDDIQSMSQYEKMLAIRTLRQYRSPLPFHDSLERQFHLMLVESYRNRRCRTLSPDCIKITKENREETTDIVVQGKIASAANACCALIGYSGCGKSSALEILLSNYPKVIEHVTDNALRLTQIVYLTIVCPTNSNFSALYSEIGAAIDRALGNTEQIYKAQVNKHKTLPAKANYICDLIERFAIGCIIFDEIQLIDFKGQKENSFESLLTIVNKTKVALLTVGTEDALEKMYPNLRTGRRAGSLIDASKYCASRSFFDFIVTDLLQYQWIDHKIEPTAEILDAFYQVTGGIIDQLIGVYMFTQIDHLLASKGNTINSKQILKVAKTHYPGMQDLLKGLNPQFEKTRWELKEKANKEIDMIIQEQQQNLAMQEIIAEQANVGNQETAILRDKIIRNIQTTLGTLNTTCDPKEIENAVDSILKTKANHGKTENELSSKAYQLLNKRKQNKSTSARHNKKSGDTTQILMDVLTNLTPPSTDKPS